MAAHTVAAILCAELTGVASAQVGGSPSLSRSSSLLLGSSPPLLHYNGLHRSHSEASMGSFMGQRGGLWSLDAQPRAAPRREASVAASASLGGLLGGLFKGPDAGEGTRQEYAAQVAQVNTLEAEIRQLEDEQLRERTQELRARVLAGASLDSVLVEAFAVVREGSRRVLGLRPFDVQLIGGMVLHKGEIAEMRTGEGKTLVAVLPAFLNALGGKGVHAVTVNDYLARRDCEWVGQVHRFLGLTVGLIQQGMSPAERRKNYLCDVTYVTNSELGFDFLRDNLATRKEDLVLREFNFCVIDEVDSILIDEARTPLIISGSAEKPSERYLKAAKIASVFAKNIHYTVDEKQKSVLITEQGYEAAEEILAVKDLYDPREQWASYILNAIKAKELFLRDVTYIVRGQEVLIVDEFTGRVMQGRRWSDGLHQAVEAKEGVKIQNETVTLASISYQNFFLQYPKLCGMTGTAATESQEFGKIYKLKVTIVPTNKPMVRRDEADVVFRTTAGKWRAAVVEIARMNKTGRPVLVGTTSVEQSESLSKQLAEAGIPHQVLNAKPENVERESEIVAQSGRLGAVTIATNMAGRGTDIILGGNPDFMAKLRLREMLMPKVVKPTDEEIAFQPQSQNKKKQQQGGAAIPAKKSWKANPALFPCELPPAKVAMAEAAVESAVQGWGARSLTELEAEDRLSCACEKGPTEEPVVAGLREAFQSLVAEFRGFTEEEKKAVVSAGGLHVVGTERHESRRIDNQLRGRSGRQGDPGSSRFFLSLEDNLFRIFGGDRIQALMRAFRVEDLPIESKMLTRALDEAQRKVEAYFFDIRKQLFDYDEVLNSQRDRVYSDRRRALVASSLQPQMIEYAELTMDDIIAAYVPSSSGGGPSAASSSREQWNLEQLCGKVRQYCPLLESLEPDTVPADITNVEQLRAFLRSSARDAYLRKREQVEAQAAGLMNEAERYFVLSQTDNLWKEHLQALKFVQTAVGLRGYAQKDPLIEYKLEGYNLFLDMMAQIRRNVIYSVYQFKPVMVQKPAPVDEGSDTTVVEGEDGKMSEAAAVAEQQVSAVAEQQVSGGPSRR